MHIVKTVSFETPLQLLDDLRTRTLRRSVQDQFIDIFRGVGDSENHKLIPTAIRQEFREKYLESSGNPDKKWTSIEQRTSESQVFKDFCFTADRAALSLPPLPPHIDQYLKAPSVGSRRQAWEEMKYDWPPDPILPHLSIAQHYGLPTRLLDWSADGLIAAFFAALSCISIVEKEKNFKHCLAIWVVNTALFDIIATDENKKIHAQLVRPPYFQNINLASQKGLFTLVKPEKGHEDEEFIPLDEYFLNKLNNVPGDDPTLQMFLGYEDDIPIFTKLELPSNQSLELLVNLFAMDKNHSTIYPGFSGVTESVMLKLRMRGLGDLFHRLGAL